MKELIIGVFLGTFLSVVLPNSFGGILISVILGGSTGLYLYFKKKKKEELKLFRG